MRTYPEWVSTAVAIALGGTAGLFLLSIRDAWRRCRTCRGRGEGTYTVQGWAGDDIAYVTCPDCSGSGRRERR